MEKDTEKLLAALSSVETKLAQYAEKAEAEAKSAGKASIETKAALDKLGEQQVELANRLRSLEQGSTKAPDDSSQAESVGQQFVKSDRYQAFCAGGASKVRVEVKNTITGGDATVAPDRRPGIVGGAFQPLTSETLFPHVPTASNAIEFTKEASFTNSAAETAEGGSKPESAVTFSLVTMPVSTVAHWIKISRQLASDNRALAAYVDTRMRYGVDLRVNGQVVTGDGVAPNLSGFMTTGNFTAHGFADAALGSVLKKLVLIRKTMASLESAGYAPDAIVLNPSDWAQIEIDVLTATSNAVRVSYDAAGRPFLFGVPVVKSIGMTADLFAVGAFAQAGTIYDREGVVVEMSESDSDNFTKNLITLRAERRLALAIERPAAIRGGDLTPV